MLGYDVNIPSGATSSVVAVHVLEDSIFGRDVPTDFIRSLASVILITPKIFHG
jgi:hypothetical protein